MFELLLKSWRGEDWIWKGSSNTSSITINADIKPFSFIPILKYTISFNHFFGFRIREESIDKIFRAPGSKRRRTNLYKFSDGKAKILKTTAEHPNTVADYVEIPSDDLEKNKSVLSQMKDRTSYREITWLGTALEDIRIYKTFDFISSMAPRLPQPADHPHYALFKDASNLALVVNRIQNDPPSSKAFLRNLRQLYSELDDIKVGTEAGTVQIFLHEKGLDHPIPATRFSDGTLGYLCILALLHDPSPPRLVCIEEPELGLHPDVLPAVAHLLVDASKRTQIIVTTHSDVLVSALSDYPEAVIVCERDDDGTHLRRLKRKALEKWLEKYALGELWRMGEIGGTRW
jgi:predicted ATPase